jgi:vancomycin aglycone glucosyltransferase
MRVLLSTIGSRGDVQPLVALALELKALGQEVHLCVPPDFREWIEGIGFGVTPVGPELKPLTATSKPLLPAMPTPEQRRQLIEGTVATQFETITAAARGCDIIVGATALQIAARSVAELMGIPYVFVAYCPTVLPSPHHAPIVLRPRGDVPPPATADNRELWARDAERYHETFGAALNAHRAARGLGLVSDTRSHVYGDHPWLAADPTLAPWPDPADHSVFQTGAWIIPDTRPLSPELEQFLDAGEPPVYFGYGSIRATEDTGRVMVETARALGRRAIVSRGWADLSLVDDAPDCIAIGEANFQALFARVAAAVHHGGAGTTTAAALAGAPQVVVPQMYDQHYWAQRVEQLGIGTAHAPAEVAAAAEPTTASLTAALERTLRPDVAVRAQSIAGKVRRDGARIAAEQVLAMGASGST